MGEAISEIRYEFLRVIVIGLETSSKAPDQAGGGPLDTNTSGDLASVLGLCLDLFGPPLFHALFDGVGVGECPSTVEVCFADVLASLTATAFRL
jgi:hypothetical protein